ncbi:MAG: aminopeptidase P family protein [Muribaculaceae bacterium]|nr:aminopeptidase P family protein [Muribaculaceae bacterium]
MNTTINERIDALRRQMKAAGIAATIIPQADPHMSEYLSNHWQARRMLSGFTGSAGDLVVTLDYALLWTDSRYFLQAAQQLEGTEIRLMKDGLPDTPSINDWLTANLTAGSVVGINGMVFSTVAAADLEMALNANGIALNTSFDPLDAIWSDRPALPESEVFVHEEKYAGKSASQKIADALARVRAQHASSAFISALDEIAWLLNIRSRDVKYNPVVTAFLYISATGSTLFVDPVKITPAVKAYLKSHGVECQPYTSIGTFIKKLPENEKVLVEAARTASGVTKMLGNRAVTGTSAVAIAKACKNDVQIAGVKAAMLRDGVAMVKSLCEIKHEVTAGKHITELDVAEILRKYRSQGDFYFDESFGTIAGYQEHGAIVHYEADEKSSSDLHPEGLLLIDSGAQYLDGTTDITRTIALGKPTADERRDFTLVMKGHIALGTAVFPEGTVGAQLDALARQFLWKEGLSYLHGTGHGVGHFLNVHEGPQSVRLNYVPTPLQPGMITSNEPGLYREGIHGIRCENLVLTVPAMTTEFGNFYKFETLTLCPFDRALFDTEIMNNQEIEWVNEYHARVRAALTPFLDREELQWLNENTEPLPLHKIEL